MPRKGADFIDPLTCFKEANHIATQYYHTTDFEIWNEIVKSLSASKMVLVNQIDCSCCDQALANHVHTLFEFSCEAIVDSASLRFSTWRYADFGIDL